MRQHSAKISDLIQISAALAIPLREQIHEQIRVINPRQIRPRRAARETTPAAPLQRDKTLTQLIIAASNIEEFQL